MKRVTAVVTGVVGAFAMLVLAGFITVGAAGCDSLYSAVVDNSDPDSGGMLTAQINADPSIELPALASGTPLVVKASSSNLVVFIACGEDALGTTAKSALGTAGGTISLSVSAASGTQLQVHAGGRGCICATGTVQLSADSGTNLTGAFSGDGVVDGTTAPCQVSGTITAIPQVLN